MRLRPPDKSARREYSEKLASPDSPPRFDSTCTILDFLSGAWRAAAGRTTGRRGPRPRTATGAGAVGGERVGHDSLLPVGAAGAGRDAAGRPAAGHDVGPGNAVPHAVLRPGPGLLRPGHDGVPALQQRA